MLSFAEFIAVLVLLGGIVTVWIQAKTDIAKIQARITDMYERSLHVERMINTKADRAEIEHLFADLGEMKRDIKIVLQRTAKLKCDDE